MPTFPSPSYHGYDVTDYRGVNPDYGTLDDLKAARRRGPRAGDRGDPRPAAQPHVVEAPLVRRVADRARGPYADWYVWSDTPAGLELASPTAIASTTRAFGAGPARPQPRNPAVTAEVTADAEFWLTDVGVDGFRLDAAKHLIEDGATLENTPETHAWWKTFRAAVEREGARRAAPRRGLGHAAEQLELRPGRPRPHVRLRAREHAMWARPSRATAARSRGRSPRSRRSTRRRRVRGVPDEPRPGPDRQPAQGRPGGAARGRRSAPDRARRAVHLLRRGDRDDRAQAGRADPDADALGRVDAGGRVQHATRRGRRCPSDPATINVAAESADPGSLLSHYRDLIRLRAAHPALASGTWTSVASDAPGVVAALRREPDRDGLVLTNVGDAAVDARRSASRAARCAAPRRRRWSSATRAVAAPAVTAAGGFAGYRPVGAIPPRSSVVIVLGAVTGSTPRPVREEPEPDRRRRPGLGGRRRLLPGLPGPVRAERPGPGARPVRGVGRAADPRRLQGRRPVRRRRAARRPRRPRDQRALPEPDLHGRLEPSLQRVGLPRGRSAPRRRRRAPRLLDEAHARGIRVLLDGVFNHSGRGFFPFQHVIESGARLAVPRLVLPRPGRPRRPPRDRPVPGRRPRGPSPPGGLPIVVEPSRRCRSCGSSTRRPAST